MKRTLAAITTAILAVGLAVVGVSSAAIAGGPVPYTVTATNVTLPSGAVFSAGGDNGGSIQYIPSSQYVSGQNYLNQGSNWTIKTVNFLIDNTPGHGAGVQGSSVLPFSTAASDGAFPASLPSSGYCIVLVQLAGYNQQFGQGGQAPICSATAAKYASAATTVIAATCQSGQTLDLSAVDHASFGPVTYGATQGDGSRTYSVTATADGGYTFAATGTNTLPLNNILAGPLTSGCATQPACVASPNYVYTFNGSPNASTAGGTITVSKSGASTGDTLCQPLYVRSATWNYDLPTDGNEPSWPQTLVGTQDLTISTIGTFAYSAPGVTGRCQQHDIYATFSSSGFGALAVPAHLDGPNDPYEPASLDSTLSGRGPNPTFSFDSSNGCTVSTPKASIAGGLCSWDAGQQASLKTVTLTYDNSASNVPVEFDVTGYPSYTRTVPAQSVVTISLPPAGSGGVTYTVTAGGTTFTLAVPSYRSCPPTVQTCVTSRGPVLSTNLAPNGWSFAATRADGHSVYATGALHIYTDGTKDVDSNNVNTDKAAGYYIPAAPIPLTAIGTPSIGYTSTSGSLPGIRLTIDTNGDGVADADLVYQGGIGSNPSGLTGVGGWWATHDLGVNDSSAPDPSYQKSWGTLDQYLQKYPNAQVLAFGYSLGAGAKGNGLIDSITAGCITYTFNDVTASTPTPASVTFQDACGTANDAVFIPTPGVNDHYSYSTVDGRDPKTGAGLFTVTATSDSGYEFSPGVTTMTWSHLFQTDAALGCADIVGDPTVTQPTCSPSGISVESGFIAVVASPGITYTIHNIADGSSTAHDLSVLSGDTDLPQGNYTVAATALPTYTLSRTIAPFTPLTIGPTPTSCVQLVTHALITPSVTAVSPSCTDPSTTTGYLQIDPSDGLNYFLGSTQLTAAKTPLAPGTYTVRAVPVDPGDSVDTSVVANPMTLVISKPGTSCSQLKTLAFTGGGPSGYLLASAVLLLLGGALIATGKPRKPRHTA